MYREQLASYLRDSLSPVLAGWEGELPEHLQKVSTHISVATLALL